MEAFASSHPRLGAPLRSCVTGPGRHDRDEGEEHGLRDEDAAVLAMTGIVFGCRRSDTVRIGLRRLIVLELLAMTAGFIADLGG